MTERDQKGNMEERRLLLALALSILVMTAWGYLYGPKAGGPRPTPTPVSPASLAPSPPPPTEATPTPTVPAEHNKAPAAFPTVAAEGERRVEALTPRAALAFTNKGASLLSWRLSRYLDAQGRGEDMVRAGRNAKRPLDLQTGDAEIDARLREALFQPAAEPGFAAGETLTLNVPVGGEAELRFTWAEGGLEARKSLRFLRDGDLVAVSATVKRDGRPLPVKVLFGPGLGTPTAEEKAVSGYAPAQGVVLGGAGVERFPAAKLTEPRRFAAVRWIGIENRYFAALLVPGGDKGGEVQAVSVPVVPADEGKTEPAALVAVEMGGEPALLFVGAKDYYALRALRHSFEEVVDIGSWIGPIVKPMLLILPRVHGLLGNYGWSILALTVVINLIMAPLRHYSFSNSLRMAKVAPEVRVIQERYRKVPLLERQAMNEEVAKVYERHGMNMSTQMTMGCLPMLLTMPFLFAIYRVLQVSIELRGASFLWIRDLSQPDPLYLTPLLMGGSMLLMQKMTPAGTMDPAQQKMMMIMPVMLTVMFVAAPAGLNLYWLASNVCSIIQQGVTMRLIGGREASPAPGRERRKK